MENPSPIRPRPRPWPFDDSNPGGLFDHPEHSEHATTGNTLHSNTSAQAAEDGDYRLADPSSAMTLDPSTPSDRVCSSWLHTVERLGHTSVHGYPEAHPSFPVEHFASPVDPNVSLEAFSADILSASSYENHDGWYTAPSDSSLGSAESLASSASMHMRRRRRRKQPFRSLQRSKPAQRRYQCTFCTDAFKTKHDWQRHESTLHLSLEKWHCARLGAFAMDSDGTIYCVFCELPHPTADHANLHNYSSCMEKPASERVFLRKDHLLQHLRHVHNGCKFNKRMESWVSSIDAVNSRCGFCDVQMTTWTERENHLAHHFKTGADMKDWKGDRGFDDEIESMVQDDMPAYMIGQQLETVEPFSASRAEHRIRARGFDSPVQQGHETADACANSSHEQSPHSYRYVEHLLLAYVSEEIRQGRVPSDCQLRRKTGEIIFGPDHDGWEQTWADNEQWLEQFRKTAGLISLPLSGGKNAFVGSSTL